MITVELKLTNPNVLKEQVTATAIYTDDVDGSTKTFSLRQADIGTGPQQIAVLDELNSQYQAELVKDTAIAAYIADLETQGAVNLQARL